MGQRRQRTVLFLGTGNNYRSRLAEALFNSVAGRMGLPWQATSRGLAPDLDATNIGPMAASAVNAPKALGVPDSAAFNRPPLQAAPEDLAAADWVVALNEREHRPLLHDRFPGWAERVEFWHVDEASEGLALVEREVHDLIARLLAGGTRRLELPPPATAEPACPGCGQPATACRCRATQGPPKEAGTVRVGQETKGRRGKGVTTVFDLPLDDAGLKDLAAALKQRCGTGGTVKDGRIEIQGEQRERVVAELERMGYRVKRTGG